MMIGKMQMEAVRAKTSRCLDPALELEARRHRHVISLTITSWKCGVSCVTCIYHGIVALGDLKDSLDSTPANFHTKPDAGAGTQAILRRDITRTCIQRRRLSCEVYFTRKNPDCRLPRRPNSDPFGIHLRGYVLFVWFARCCQTTPRRRSALNLSTR